MAANDEGQSNRTGSAGPGLFAAARRYPFIVVAFVLIGAAVAVGATFALPTHYTARAELVLGDNNEVTLYRTVQPANAAARAQVAATAMRSDEVFERAQTLLKDKISAKGIENSVVVAPSDSAALVTVSATRNQPGAARDVANAVARAYSLLTREQNQTQANRAQATLKRQQESGLAELDTVQQKQATRTATIESRYADVLVLSDRARLVQGALNTDTAYQSLTRQADRLSQTLADLRQTLTETRVDTQLVTGGLDTLYPATKPGSATASNLRRNVLLGGVLGLLCGVVVAWRRLDRRRGINGDLVAEMLGAPMLGQIKRARELRSPTGVIDLSQGRALADHLKVVSTSVVLDLRKRGLGAVLVTSAEPREGRTVLALNLAAAAQASGQDVWLIDGDVRHPDLTTEFELGSGPGLRDLMSGSTVSQPELVTYAEGRALPMIPLGGPTTASGSGKLDLRRGDGTQPIAFVDSTALGGDPFVLEMASSGWAGLLVIVSDASSVDDLASFRSRANMAGAPILGFILNNYKAPRRRPRAGSDRRQGKRRVQRPAPAVLADSASAK